MTSPCTPTGAAHGTPSTDRFSADATRQPARARRWLAVLLSLVAIGTGHVYAGRTARGVAWVAALVGMYLVLGALTRPVYDALGPAGLWALCTPTIVVYLGAAVDAAKRAPERAKTVRGWLVAATFVAIWLGRLPFDRISSAYFVDSIGVSGPAQFPTLLAGDHVLIDKRTPRSRAPERGELVTVPSPDWPDRTLVKRVVALAGDTVQLHGGQLLVNGWPVPRCRVGRSSYDEEDRNHEGSVWLEFLGDSSYLVFEDESTKLALDDADTWSVDTGAVFVLGDNRRYMDDSRVWVERLGSGVPIPTVRGFPVMVYLSLDVDKNPYVVDRARMGADLTGRKPLAPPGLADDVARCLEERPPGTLGPR